MPILPTDTMNADQVATEIYDWTRAQQEGLIITGLMLCRCFDYTRNGIACYWYRCSVSVVV
jgi:hypothetical protein